MPKTVSQLPAAAAADRNAVVAADNAAATLTEKVTLGQIADLSAYHLSASTTNATPTVLSGDSLTLQNGEAWQFEVKVVAVNRKTSATKVWSIRGGIRRTFGGATALVGSLDTQTTGSIGGGNLAVTAGVSGLVITATGLANAGVEWTATVLTSEETATQQALVGGCTDPDVANYNANADFDNGSCTFPAFPSSPNLKAIAYEGEIEGLDVTVGENAMYPAFDPAIKDYYVVTSSAYSSSASYSVAINEDAPLTGTTLAGKTLQINDGTNYYYVRLLPSDVYPADIQYGPGAGYEAGYYTTALTFNGPSSPYYYIYDQHGVPVWYGRTATDIAGTFPGYEANRVALCAFSSGSVARLNSASTNRRSVPIVASAIYGTPAWDVHECHEIASPPSRRGNVIVMSYNQGFYLQETGPDGGLVWEWHSKEYFNSQVVEFYHANSIDVHPVTGDVLVSLRNCSAVLCIEYATKDVLWVLQGSTPESDTLQSTAKPEMTAGTKWLTINDEPTIGSYSYSGTRAQHDARWLPDEWATASGNAVVSVFDNQSQAGGDARSRGVIYEIDYAAGEATHRSSIFSDVGTSPYMGSYTVKEIDGSITHTINFVTEHPCLKEYVGSIDGSKTKVLEADIPGDIYRIVKAPASFFRADNLRATCGINVDTGAFLAADSGGGGGGSGTSLLLHFDGTNGSTTFTDSSSNAFAVTAGGGAQISTAQSKFGGASALFDGSGDYLSISNNSALMFGENEDFCIELWFRPASLSGFRALIGAYGALPWLIQTNGSAVRFFADNGVVNVSSGSSLNVGEWSHIAVTREGADIRVFLNGAIAATATGSQAFSSANDIVIGGEGTVDFSDGYIDELRIVKGAAVYTDDFTPPTAPF